MAARGSGRLVGIGSVAAIRGLPGHGAYCASKAGVVGYCESLRGEMRASGVKVGDALPRLCRHAADAGQPLRHALPAAADEFADRAFRAIEAGTSYRVIPWQMGVVAKLMRMLPNPLFDRLFKGRGRKRRRGRVAPQRAAHEKRLPQEPFARGSRAGRDQ